jgi:hypothetical protein
MENYDVELSKIEVKKMYSLLIDKITEHVKILSLNDRPITSIMAVKRALLRLKIDYLNPEPVKDSVLSQEQEKLAIEILECLGIDVKQTVDSGLIGTKEMKRTLVRYHYERMAKSGISYKKIKEELSRKYGFSVSAIEKIIYRKRI